MHVGIVQRRAGRVLKSSSNCKLMLLSLSLL